MTAGRESPPRKVLVAGGPRTGTTWVARALSLAEGASLVHEPDNEWPKPFALKAKLGLGRFPVLGPDDPAPRLYEELWERAFKGYRTDRASRRLARWLYSGRTDPDLWRALCDHRTPEVSWRLRLLTALAPPPWKGPPAAVVIAKSVYAPLALEWISARFRPDVLIVLRHPLSVIASWVEIGWGGCALESNPRVHDRFGARLKLPELPPGSSPLARVAWEVGLFTSVLEASLEDHPEWTSVGHEDLLVDSVERFRELYARIGLTWTDDSEEFVLRANRPGAEPFDINRVAADLVDKWRKRLSEEQLGEIWPVLSTFDAPWVARVASELGA